MNRLKKILALTLAGVLMGTSVITTTVIIITTKSLEALSAPVISIDGHVVSWTAVSHTDGYNVRVTDLYDSTVSNTIYTAPIFNVADLDLSFGTYKISVQSRGGKVTKRNIYTDSAFSNSVSYSLKQSLVSTLTYFKNSILGDNYIINFEGRGDNYWHDLRFERKGDVSFYSRTDWEIDLSQKPDIASYYKRTSGDNATLYTYEENNPEVWSVTEHTKANEGNQWQSYYLPPLFHSSAERAEIEYYLDASKYDVAETEEVHTYTPHDMDSFKDSPLGIGKTTSLIMEVGYKQLILKYKKEFNGFERSYILTITIGNSVITIPYINK